MRLATGRTIVVIVGDDLELGISMVVKHRNVDVFGSRCEITKIPKYASRHNTPQLLCPKERPRALAIAAHIHRTVRFSHSLELGIAQADDHCDEKRSAADSIRLLPFSS
jgi:hypothetical protein